MNNVRKVKILDCTLRDGGYYTNWDFSKNIVNTYVDGVNNLPIEYLEIGYRSRPLKGYLGEFFYCPEQVLVNLKERSSKNLAIMLNEKDVRVTDVSELLTPCLGLITLVRIAIDPANFMRALDLASEIKKMGFEVAFNVMYMSKWHELPEFVSQLHRAQGLCDYFYMVDSFGGVYPEDVKRIYHLVNEALNVPIGFHGHNNLELALINTLTAIECGADIVDSTITGMGRGAGNLKTELLLTSLNAMHKIEVNFNSLSSVVDAFQTLQDQYGWGTNLPYMVSGANSLPQKEVMEWVGKRFYSFNSIIRALGNQFKGVKDNLELKKLDFSTIARFRRALIIGGGPSAVLHAEAINKFIQDKSELIVIHASSKNALHFQHAIDSQVFCLVGNEGYRLEKVFSQLDEIKGVCVLPPFPRKMGTYIPDKMLEVSFELSAVTFTEKFKDSHTALALQTAIELQVEEIFITGYDGYNSNMDRREHDLLLENEFLFSSFKKSHGRLVAITPTEYSELEAQSVYGWI